MFNQIRDVRGILSVFEFKKLPFKPKRVFLLHDLYKDRGGHYHKKCKQIITVVKGKCDFILENKKNKVITKMQKVAIGTSVYIAPYVKISIQKPTKDCIICVICNKSYDPKDAYYD